MPATYAEDGWQNLFNGKDTSGWVQRGGRAKYTVENGEIVGTAVAGTPNSFLCTEKNYENFILELEFKCDSDLNSGVQVRSEANAKNQPFGYQIEIDVSAKNSRWWTAGVYDEGRRSWLFPGARGGDAAAFTTQGGEVTKQGEWNKLRVEASGDIIRTYLNDTPRAAIRDDLTLTGFIGLQVHNVSKKFEGTQIRFRNIRIKEGVVPGIANGAVPLAELNYVSQKEAADGWKLLWSGNSTQGWRSAKGPKFPAKGWSIKNGVLSVAETGGGEANAAGDIITAKTYSDFEMVCDFKMTRGANSGIKYFVQPDLNKSPTGSAIGLEYQILDDAVHLDAKRGKDGNRTLASLYDLLPASKDKKPNPIGEWNTARIVSKGNHVEHWLNGQKVLEYDRKTDNFRAIVQGSKYKVWDGFGEWTAGNILLQDHGNEVSFRNVKIRELK
ncbi:MAG: DUF1080 domain-containing protein [Puniceicoccales bacterium]|nr:DUF1080 domain-containing protein [Puniceicoccales bacterium]